MSSLRRHPLAPPFAAPPVTSPLRAAIPRTAMKPPMRARLVPARFLPGPGPGPGRARAAWSAREKRALLAALRAQAALGLPEPLSRPLRERLPRRSEAEIAALVQRLRGRAAREAVRTRYRQCLEQLRRRRAQLPAPIEVWLELAEALAEGLEEVTAAAFSQVLTVAATEPLTLLHSVPPHPPSPVALTEQGGAAPGAPPDPPAQPLLPGDFTIDFQRVYEYLARLCRGGKGPPLPPAESAVLLALLGSLPPELGALDCAALHSHLRGSYSTLTAPCPPGTVPPGPPTTPGPPLAGWRGVGLCPLNLFLVPLRLLARADASG
ncbi:snRNA-activating protein complex subunit 2 [Opisthocomus hoazin]|uniref:snRNA-activating protein complex subunit 2 n=1 Tax=Opisthocomus hoazin TaxID=30419 RepID=UPI003F53A165